MEKLDKKKVTFFYDGQTIEKTVRQRRSQSVEGKKYKRLSINLDRPVGFMSTKSGQMKKIDNIQINFFEVEHFDRCICVRIRRYL